jgi:hypothetical protein
MTQQQERPAPGGEGGQDRLDFTKPHTFPRSGRDLLGGVAYLGRAVDKTRADLNGTAGEYIWACPQSRRVYDFYGISPEQFREAVQQNPNDEGVVRWLQEHGPKQPGKAELDAFNQQMLSAGPGPEQMGWFKQSLEEMGQGHRTDVKTFVDMQDLEEERL